MTAWIFSSSVLIVCIVSLRWLLRGRITQRVQYALWGLVLVRLLVPIHLGSSAMSVLNVTQVPAVPTTVVSQVAALEGTPVTVIAPLELPVTQEVSTPNLPSWQSMVWVTGSTIIGAWFVYTNLSFRRKLKRSRILLGCQGCKLPVYVVEGLETPCLFASAIYVTSATATNAQQLAHVLSHEQTHHRHGDHIWSLLRCVCLVVHWYNPLVWWAAVLSSRDCELACDEATIATFAPTERMAYGYTLLEMACTQTPSLLMTASTMVGGQKTLKERIGRIAHKATMARYTVIGLGLVVVCVVGVTFTGAIVEAAVLPENEAPPIETEPAKQEPLTPENIDHSGIQVSPQDYFTIAPTQEPIPEDEPLPTASTVDEPTDTVREQVKAQYQSDATVLYTDPGQMDKYVERQMAAYDQNLANRIPSSDSLSNQLYHGKNDNLEHWFTTYPQGDSTLGALWVQTVSTESLPAGAFIALAVYDSARQLVSLSSHVVTTASTPLMVATIPYSDQGAFIDVMAYNGGQYLLWSGILHPGTQSAYPAEGVTDTGKTYGYLPDLSTSEIADFIAVVGTNGNSGYIESKYILPSATAGQTLPVYNLEGMVVDTFTIAPILLENVAEKSWQTIESELRGYL